MKKRVIIFFLFFGGMNFIFCQLNEVNNLKKELNTFKNDTTELKLMNDLALLIAASNPDSALLIYQQVEIISKKKVELSPVKKIKNGILKQYGVALSNIGYLTAQKGNDENALSYYEKALQVRKEIDDKPGVAYTLNSLGIFHYNRSELHLALKYYNQSLKSFEALGDKDGCSESLLNIAAIYNDQGDADKAIETTRKALNLFKETDDKEGISQALNNIGAIFKGRQMFDSAVKYFQNALVIRKETRNKKGIANSYSSLGSVAEKTGKFKQALDFYTMALSIREEIHNKKGIANSLNNMSSVFFQQKKYAECKINSEKALALGTELGYPECVRNAAEKLYLVYSKNGQPQKALEMYELYIQMRDSISNQETKKASIKTQLKYEYEKKSAADSVKNEEQQRVKDAQLAAQTASLKQEKFQRYSLVVGLSLVVCGLLFVINRFRITQKQKKIIEEQKIKVDEAFEKLHEKNKEVLDSIYYARRIQRALITNEKYIERVLNNYKL